MHGVLLRYRLILKKYTWRKNDFKIIVRISSILTLAFYGFVLGILNVNIVIGYIAQGNSDDGARHYSKTFYSL